MEVILKYLVAYLIFLASFQLSSKEYPWPKDIPVKEANFVVSCWNIHDDSPYKKLMFQPRYYKTFNDEYVLLKIQGLNSDNPLLALKTGEIVLGGYLHQGIESLDGSFDLSLTIGDRKTVLWLEETNQFEYFSCSVF